jgi:hypothetical protein
MAAAKAVDTKETKIIRTTGKVEAVDPPADKKEGYTLKQMQTAVGGNIDYLAAGKFVFVVNDDGMLTKPLNEAATKAYNAIAVRKSEGLYGDVFVCLAKYFK